MNDDAQIAQLVRYLALHLLGNAAPEMQNDADVLANHRGLVFHARMIQALLQHRTEAAAAPVAPATVAVAEYGERSYALHPDSLRELRAKRAAAPDTCHTASSTCTGCSVCAGPSGVTGAGV